VVIESTPSFAGATRLFDAAGEATRDSAEVGYTEIAFGTRVTVRREGLGFVRVAWAPGAVLVSGYEKDARRVSDPWSDLQIGVGVEVLGPESRILETRRLVATLGLAVTVPPWRPDYAEQSEAQKAGELYIADNQGLHAWAFGAESVGAWSVPIELTQNDEWRLLWSTTWDRYLPMPYEASGLEAYRRKALRAALAEASGVATHGKIDYRNRIGGAVGGATAWRLGDFVLGGSAGVSGWTRQAPAVDGTVVEDTGAAALAVGVVLDAAYELFSRGALGLRVGGAVSVVGKNSPEEARTWVSAYLRLGPEPAVTSIF
jgi:hypothetical protein